MKLDVASSRGKRREVTGAAELLTAAKGGGFLAGGSLVEFVSRFFIALLLARALEATGYGLYTLTVSAGALFAGISRLGLDDAMVRYVAIMSGRKDERGLWGTVQIGFLVSALTGPIAAAALYLAAEPIAAGVFHEPRLTELLKLMAIILPFLNVSAVLLGCARGYKRMDYAAVAENVVQSVVRLVVLGVLFLIGLNVFTAVVVFGVADVAASITLITLLNREARWRPLRRDVRRDVRQVFGFAIPLWLSGLLNQFRKNIETVILGAMASIASVGIFSIVGRIQLAGHAVYRAMIVSVKPVLAQLHDRGDRAELSQVYRSTTRWTLALNIPFFLVSVLYPEQLLAVFGESFVSGAPALVILAVSELIIAGTGICGSLIDMTGHTGAKLVNSVVWMVVLLGTSLWLIPRYGILGAATASLIATGVVNLLRVSQVWFLEHLSPYDRSYWKPATAALGAYLAGLAMLRFLPIEPSLWSVAAQALAVVGTYLGLTLIFRLAPEDRLVIGRVGRRLGRFVGRS